MGKGFTLYREDIEALRESMDPSSAFELICRFADYMETGEEPESYTPLERLGFALLKARNKETAGTAEPVETVKPVRQEKAEKPRAAAGSDARSKAAKAAWDRRKNPVRIAQEEPEPEERKEAQVQNDADTTPDPIAQSVYDPDVKKVTDAYQREIGMLPIGTAFDKLMSFAEDLGADTVCVGIEYTNQWQANDPPKFLYKILNKWAETGIDTPEKARASILEWNRARERNSATAKEKEKQAANDPPAIEGGFY